MEIKYLCPYWGSEEYQPQTFIDYVKDKGYDGIEINIPNDTIFETKFYDALNKVRRESPNFICGLQQVFSIKKETPDYLKSRKSQFSITPEFGPFPYMPQAPFTQEPLSSQREINERMKDYLKSQLS